MLNIKKKVEPKQKNSMFKKIAIPTIYILSYGFEFLIFAFVAWVICLLVCVHFRFSVTAIIYIMLKITHKMVKLLLN